MSGHPEIGDLEKIRDQRDRERTEVEFKTKGGRPPLPPEKRRNVILSVRVTEIERDIFQALASASGTPLAVYIREAAARDARNKVVDGPEGVVVVDCGHPWHQYAYTTNEPDEREQLIPAACPNCGYDQPPHVMRRTLWEHNVQLAVEKEDG